LNQVDSDSRDVILICLAKTIRTVGFGAISVILALYLLKRGFTNAEVGMLLSATLLEDAILTTLAAAIASKVGVRAVLLVSCAVIVVGGALIANADTKWLLALAVVTGIVSPAGYEGGPFAALEQTIISQATASKKLTSALSWYNMVGFGGAALGALLAAGIVGAMHSAPTIHAYQMIFLLYSFGGMILAAIYGIIKIKPFETKPRAIDERSWRTKLFPKRTSGASDKSRKYIWQLAGLQSLDAFGGGFIVQSMLTLWFYERYQVDATFLGPVYFWCNVIAALSFAFAPLVVRRLGLLNTMVFTHLPCSLTLCLLPFLPSAPWAAGLLLLRSGFSSMDIPVRQAYTMLIVAEEDRPFAAGLTTSSRAIAQGIAPTLTGLLMQNVMTGIPLILAGALKSVYDISLYLCFKNVPVRGLVEDKIEANEPGAAAKPEVAAEREVVASAR